MGGGEETKVPGLESLMASGWAVVGRGILWLDVTRSNPPAAIWFRDFATRQVVNVGNVSAYVMPSATGFSAARHGNLVMWSQLDRATRDLKVIEGFR